jgi:hypothetical protein
MTIKDKTTKATEKSRTKTKMTQDKETRRLFRDFAFSAAKSSQHPRNSALNAAAVDQFRDKLRIPART